MFILFCGLVTHSLVGNYFNFELAIYLKNGHFSNEFALFIGQLLFQTIVFKLLKENDLFTYLGHVAFISLLGAILLGCAELALNVFESFNFQLELLPSFIFGAVVFWMIIEHHRRVKLLGWSSWLTVSLIVFRVLIYPLVFKF